VQAAGHDAFVGDDALRTPCERHLQLAILLAIDIAIHLVAEDSAKTPDDYGSSFAILAEMKVLNSDLATRMRSAAGLRNILVHAYLDVDPERLWNHLSSLGELDRFASAIERYVEQSPS
jgi:uncharacterized protein YutE (UPF0331/DUF86 family)